jgi:AcrR family transcriptional regulator
MARPRSFDEATVLEAARRQFRAGGYAGTSVAELTAATGLGKGSLYGAFGDKHALYLDALDGYCDRAVAGLGEALQAPPWKITLQLRKTMLALAEPDERGWPCMLTQASAELGSSDPDVARRVSHAFGQVREAFASTIRRAQEVGQLDPAADPAELAEFLLVVQRGLEALANTGADPELLRRAAARAVDALPRPGAAPIED